MKQKGSCFKFRTRRENMGATRYHHRYERPAKTRRNSRGFTLVEISISILFIGLLSIALAVIVTGVMNTYRRSLVLTRVNSVGAEIVSDLRTAIQNSTTYSALDLCATYYNDMSKSQVVTSRNNCLNDGARAFVHLEKTANVTISGETTNLPIYGVLCTGTYSYIWQSGYMERAARTGANITIDGNPAQVTFRGQGNIRLLKIADSRRAVCASTFRTSEDAAYQTAATVSSNLAPAFIVETPYNDSIGDTDELLSKTEESDLALYSFTVANPAESSTLRNTFFSGSFILGTVNENIDITAQGKSCELPSDYGQNNFNPCAINLFTFAAQVTGN